MTSTSWWCHPPRINGPQTTPKSESSTVQNSPENLAVFVSFSITVIRWQLSVHMWVHCKQPLLTVNSAQNKRHKTPKIFKYVVSPIELYAMMRLVTRGQNRAVEPPHRLCVVWLYISTQSVYKYTDCVWCVYTQCGVDRNTTNQLNSSHFHFNYIQT